MPAKLGRARKALLLATPVVLIAAIAIGYFAFFRDRSAKNSQSYSYPPRTYAQKVKSFDDLWSSAYKEWTELDCPKYFKPRQ